MQSFLSACNENIFAAIRFTMFTERSLNDYVANKIPLVMKQKLLQCVCYRVVDTKSTIRSARNPGESSTMPADWTSE